MKSFLFLTCFGLAFTIFAQPTATGIQAYFPFDGNAQDLGPNSYQIAVNNASLTADRFNVSGRAYYFNGTNANIELSSNFPDMSSLSIGFWFKPDGTQSNDTGYIFWEGDGVCGKDVSIAYLNQKIYIRADKNGSTLNGMINQGMIDLSLISAALNGWYHIMWVMQPTQSLIYVNGQYRTTASVNGSGVGTHYHPTFGCLNDGGTGTGICGTPKGHFLKGSLDDIQIYSLALTAGAVDTIFQRTSVNTSIYTITETYFSVYPNPSATGEFSFYSNQKIAAIHVFDFTGREIGAPVNNTSGHSGTINLSGYGDGVYLLRLEGANGVEILRIRKGR